MSLSDADNRRYIGQINMLLSDMLDKLEKVDEIFKKKFLNNEEPDVESINHLKSAIIHLSAAKKIILEYDHE